MTGTAMTVVSQLKESRGKAIAAFLPKGTEVRELYAQVARSIEALPKIAECTEISIFSAVTTLAAAGAEIGRDGYLIPYKDTKSGKLICTAVFDYKYLCALVRACTGYTPFAERVFEGDYFEYEQGSNAYVRHKPASLMRKPKGAYLGTYACLPAAGGRCRVLWKPADELNAHRKRFSHQWKNGEAPDWYDPKTALKELVKTEPHSPKLAILQRQLVQEEDPEKMEQIPEAEVTSIETAEQVTTEATTKDGEVIDDSDFSVEDEPADGITLAMARAMRVNGEPGQFNGMAGKRLDECSDSFLERYKEWCTKKLEGPGGLRNGEELIRGVWLVQEARKRGELKAPEKTPPVGSETSGQLADRLGKQRETAKAGVGAADDSDPFA